MRLPVMPRRARSGVIEVRRGREKLPTRYSDDAVLKMATRDGQSGFNTNRWGPGNRQEYGLGVVRATAGTHGAAVRVALEEDLAKVAVAHVHEREKFGVCRATAYNALTPVARTATRRHLLMRKLAEHELGEPTSRWPVLVFLGLLILGDLIMTSTAMQVLNLSDRRFVSWLPFAEVHLAAVPVVVGMFGAAHWLGESLKAYRYEPQLRLARKIIAGLSATAALARARSSASSWGWSRWRRLPRCGQRTRTRRPGDSWSGRSAEPTVTTDGRASEPASRLPPSTGWRRSSGVGWRQPERAWRPCCRTSPSARGTCTGGHSSTVSRSRPRRSCSPGRCRSLLYRGASRSCSTTRACHPVAA